MDTTVAPNNRAIVFRGRSIREMPVVSRAQNAAMHAAAEGKSTLGIPKSVGAEFVKDQAPGSVKTLPARLGKKASRLGRQGLISDRQMRRLNSAKGT